MIQSLKPWEKDPIEYLVRVRFPGAFVPPPSLAAPVERNVAASQLREEADAYRRELEACGPEQLRQRLQEALTAQATAQALAVRDPLSDSSGADFAYHAKLSYWTIDEAVALSMGRFPFFGGWDRVRALQRISAIASEFAARREIVERARVMGQLWHQTVPGVFIAWAQRMGFALPPELVMAVQDLGVQIADWKTAYETKARELSEARAEIGRNDEQQLKIGREHLAVLKDVGEGWAEVAKKQSETIEVMKARISTLIQRIADLENSEPPPKPEPSTRERQSLLKLAIGMAMKKYHYGPALAKNSAISNIATHLRELGIPLDEDTIRKYLNEAKELLGEKETV